MNKVCIYFKDDDYIEVECKDILLDHGMLIIFMQEYSENGDPTTIAHNLSQINSFEFYRMKGEENNEGLSEEQQH